ncbi:TIGR02594 family protein [Vibrio campbellii]|uniref:TIGR02594 family protein n=1 Tax=Vibrio campbellii TaxID=680 RepID=UPI0009A5372D|nr:TIGR02594 family protein [Vibrio campbellii]OPH50862.1 hypothetical protein B4U81_16195 [Vibrio campbellii]
MQLKIRSSVGVGGINAKSDIIAVQQVLNHHQNAIGFRPKLVVDGSLGRNPMSSKTVAAIKACQRRLIFMVRPDGRIDVNGKTHRKLNSVVPTSPRKNSKPQVESLTTKVTWMKTAFGELGQTEVPGAKANPRILEYFSASKFWGTDDSGGQNAWCGSFVAWVFKQHDIKPVKEAYRAKEWEAFGKSVTNPIHGALGIKTRRGGGHVAFVVGKSPDGKYLYMLGGNQNNQVNIAKYPLTAWDKFVVPNSYDDTKGTLPIYTKGAVKAGEES